jgi:hypothetical protein
VLNQEDVVDETVAIEVRELRDIDPAHRDDQHLAGSTSTDPVTTHGPSQPSAASGALNLIDGPTTEHVPKIVLLQDEVTAMVAHGSDANRAPVGTHPEVTARGGAVAPATGVDDPTPAVEPA